MNLNTIYLYIVSSDTLFMENPAFIISGSFLPRHLTKE